MGYNLLWVYCSGMVLMMEQWHLGWDRLPKPSAFDTAAENTVSKFAFYGTYPVMAAAIIHRRLADDVRKEAPRFRLTQCRAIFWVHKTNILTVFRFGFRAAMGSEHQAVADLRRSIRLRSWIFSGSFSDRF